MYALTCVISDLFPREAPLTGPNVKTQMPPSEFNSLTSVIFLRGLRGSKIKENPYYA